MPVNILAPFQQGSFNSFTYNPHLPRASELLASADQSDTPKIEYQEAFYGNEKDVPKISRSYGGREFRLKSKNVSNLPEFDLMGRNSNWKQRKGLQKPDFKFWQVVAPPPSRKEAIKWLLEQKEDKDTGVQNADPGELDQFSQVSLKYFTNITIILSLGVA